MDTPRTLSKANRQPRRLTRHGFTLIEMLVTFSIIAVLAALVAAGIMSWINGQARRNTEAEIRTLYSALAQHWEAVASDAENEKVIPQTVLTYADNDAARARVVWVKLRLMEAFPVRFEELTSSNGYAAPLDKIPSDRRRYRANFRQKISGKTGTQTKTESAACLLMALNTSHFGITHPDDLFRPFTRDTDNDGLFELTDGWGEPLYFYRFATGNTELQGKAPANNRAAGSVDPRDPTGKLLGWSGGNSGTFDLQIHTRRKTASEAWYAVPLLASSGPDRLLGLTGNGLPPAPYQDATSSTPGAAIDDLYSFKLK